MIILGYNSRENSRGASSRCWQSSSLKHVSMILKVDDLGKYNTMPPWGLNDFKGIVGEKIYFHQHWNQSLLSACGHCKIEMAYEFQLSSIREWRQIESKCVQHVWEPCLRKIMSRNMYTLHVAIDRTRCQIAYAYYMQWTHNDHECMGNWRHDMEMWVWWHLLVNVTTIYIINCFVLDPCIHA